MTPTAQPGDRRGPLKVILPLVLCALALGIALGIAVSVEGRGQDRHLAHAASLLAAGRCTEALAAYQDALDRNPRDAEAVWGIASVHLATDNQEMARRYLDTYLSLAPAGPHAPDAREARAGLAGEPAGRRPQQGGPPTLAGEVQAADEEGKQAGGGSYFQKMEEGRGREIAGELREAMVAYEGAAKVTGVPVQAAQALECAARCAGRLDPPDYGLAGAYYFQAAEFYRRSNQPQEASRCSLLGAHASAMQAGTVAGPPQPPAGVGSTAGADAAAAQRLQAAKSAFARNDFARAAQEARAAGPSDPEALFVLGSALIWLGDWDSAREALQRYLSLAPNGPRAAEASSQLDSITRQRLVLQSVFDDGGAGWQYSATGTSMLEASNVPGAPASGFVPRGLALAVGPGGWARADIEPVVEGAVELWAAVTGGAEARISLSSKDGPAGEPLAISDRAWGSLRGATHVGSGWHQVSIGIRQETIDYFVDRVAAGRVERTGPVSRIELAGTGNRGAVLIDAVRIVSW